MDDDGFPVAVGQWERKKILGRGSFGQVSLWENKNSKEYVAIKKCIILTHTYNKPQLNKLLERWENELDIMRKANCPYIVKTITVSPSEFIDELNKRNSTGFPLFFMEYCDGGDVRQLLSQIKHSNGLKESEVRKILKTLRMAVEYLQSINITHRDLKPENIVIQRTTDGNVYKLADLGYAKEIFATYDHSVVGTAGYLAPEITCSVSYSHRVDYWSMGVIAFEIICGIRPFIPHQTLRNWAVQIKNKTSRHLAITENNCNEFQQHEKIFNENQISNYFQIQIEQWLRLALDGDAKQRGSVFEKVAPDELQLPTTTTAASPPVNVLKFYTLLDEILSTKILTIFCLTSYQFLSYPLNQLKNLTDLKEAIQRDTTISSENIYMILPIEQKSIEQINENTQPIDLYIENCETPMLYVTGYNYRLELKITKPYISETIQDIVNINVDLQLFYLKEYCRQILYLFRNEQNHYTQLLTGLRTYVMNLNHAIIKFKPFIIQTNNKSMIFCANIKTHIATISYSRNKIEELHMENSCIDLIKIWDKYCEEMEDDLKVCEINAKNQKSYESVLRRSQEAINSKFLLVENVFEIAKIEEYYEKLRCEKSISKDTIKKTKDLLTKYFYENIKRRATLLKSRELENIYSNIIGVHAEFIKIKNITEKMHEKIDKCELGIQQASFKHQDDLFAIISKFEAQKYHQKHLTNINNDKPLNANRISSENIPFMDKDDMNTLSDLNITEKFNFKLGSSSSLPPSMIMMNGPMATSCFGESNDTKELIDEANQISMAFNDLIYDFAV